MPPFDVILKTEAHMLLRLNFSTGPKFKWVRYV